MTKACIVFLFSLFCFACFAQSDKDLSDRTAKAIGFAEQGKLEEAFEEFIAIKKAYKKRGDTEGLARTTNNIARIYYMMNDPGRARSNFWQSYHLYRSIGHKTGQADALTNIGASYETDDSKEQDTALSLHLKAHELYLQAGDSAGMTRTLMNIGTVYGHKHQTREALKAYLEAATFVERKDMTYERTVCAMDIAACYYDLDQPDSALTYLYKALAMKPTPEVENNLYETFAKVYALLNQPDSVAHYFDLFVAAKNKLENEQTARNIAEISQKYEAQVRQEEIELLKLGKKKDRLWYTVIALSLGGIIVILMLFFRNRMIRSDHQRTDLEHRILRAQMNPHFLFNCLSSIQRMYIEGDTQKANDLTSDFGTLLRQILDHTSRTRIRLKDELDTLQAYMEIEQIRLDRKFSFAINVDEELDVNSILVPSLITQPMVENAIWHGIVPLEGSGEITVDCRLGSDEKHLVLTISDNGVGFAPEDRPEKHASKGIELVEKRLTSKGALTITRGEAGGTTVTIKLPVEYEN